MSKSQSILYIDILVLVIYRRVLKKEEAKLTFAEYGGQYYARLLFPPSGGSLSAYICLERQAGIIICILQGGKEGGEIQLLVQGYMSDMLGSAHRTSHPKVHALLEAPCHCILETKNNQHFQHCTGIYLAFFILFYSSRILFNLREEGNNNFSGYILTQPYTVSLKGSFLPLYLTQLLF